MPFTIDLERFSAQETLDLSNPQGTPQGIPVKQIPHQEFPRVLYRHPNEPFQKVIHRNTNHEIVHQELVPAEALSIVVSDHAEMSRKLKEGWVKEPYIPQAPPDPNAHLYQAKEAR